MRETVSSFAQTENPQEVDLFKAYFEREFKKLIDSGQFAFVDRHLILNGERYVICDQAGNAMLSEYARYHADECGAVFTKGYYSQFMRSSVSVENQVKYSFELNAHNTTLLEQIKNEKPKSEALRKYSGSFAETLVVLQKYRKLSNKQLADRLLVG